MNAEESAEESADKYENLIYLADKYENSYFLQKDPSQFMHNYASVEDQEVAAFISANIAFGRRDQILLHVKAILDNAGASPAKWIKDGSFLEFFPDSDKSFYRMYSYSNMRLFCQTIRSFLLKAESLGSYFHNEYQKACLQNNSNFPVANSGKPLLSSIISAQFPKECPVIAKGVNSACKKINMFLRWMVRDNSPVDLGLWSDWYKKTDLLMPLDTHVMQQSVELGLLPLTAGGKAPSASLKTAIALTDTLRKIFPDDPVRADFALFGLGVDTD